MPTHLYLWIICWQKQATVITLIASAGECVDASAAQATTQSDATGQVRPQYYDSSRRVVINR
jgi:hypothetical protein